jgi:hypothetical protein
MPANSGLNLGEQVAIDFCLSYGLRCERFTKAEIRSGKTPDFRVYKDKQLVFYCEAKHVQHDDWLDKQLEKARPGEIVGGLRPDPIFNRIAGHIHQAAKQFEAVNHDHQYPNVLVFTNSDRLCKFDDLVSTLTGNLYAEGGTVEPIYRSVSEGRIREEKSTIDLYVWFNEWRQGKKQSFFIEGSPHYPALCALLGSDPTRHRHV